VAVVPTETTIASGERKSGNTKIVCKTVERREW